jgi:hypothetical protein
MNRRLTLSIIGAALTSTAFAAFAQDAQSVAGTYAPVKIPAFGDQPRGQMILTADGRYSILVSRADMPKIAAGTRTNATPEENKMVVNGSIAHTGRYTIDDGGKSITFHVETSTFPNWNGTTQKRPLKVQGDTLSYVVTAPSAGGGPNETLWKRVK